jgi:chromosome segregation ATPase
MHGQVMELRDQLRDSAQRVTSAEENFAKARAELENVRGHMYELEKWKREYNENLQHADSERRTAKGEAEYIK